MRPSSAVTGALPCSARREVPRPPSRERWVSGYLYLVSGLALGQRPGREHASAIALCRALAAKHELGDVVGTAYSVEALAWLAARREQYERTAWLLGVADQLWNRTGRRLSGVALMEESRQRTVKAARKALGERRFTAAYAHGTALDLDAVARDAADEISEAAGQRVGDAGDSGGGADHPAAAMAIPAAAALLTRREQEIAELVASGLSNREIAARLFISKRTVDAHVEHIFSKLEISSRVQLTVLLQAQAPRARAALGSTRRRGAQCRSPLPRDDGRDQVGHAQRGVRVQDLRLQAAADERASGASRAPARACQAGRPTAIRSAARAGSRAASAGRSPSRTARATDSSNGAARSSR